MARANRFKWLYILLLFSIVSVSPRKAQEATPIQQRLLNVAKTKFNSINNRYYQYQMQKTCSNCPICNIQSMNIIVTDNTASYSEFAEGNEYALTHFCLNDDNVFKQRITDSTLTIDDLFNVIEESITNEVDIGVIYHEDIGIPLSISINTNEEAVNTEFIAINCITFDPLYPSPDADTLSDIIKASKTTRNTRNRDSTTSSITIDVFNNDDPYSCDNISVPSQCGDNGDYFKCFRYNDGCNTCSCDSDGMVIGCTQRVCDTDINTHKGECIDCESNTEWAICGGNTGCIPDCSSPDNLCGIASTSDCSSSRCECGSSAPRWNGAQCITESECGIHNKDAIDHQNGVCVPHCSQYTDGCLLCNCNNNGEVIDTCTLQYDERCSFDNKECIKCEDPDTMYYTECGTPDITCSDIDTFVGITECIEKCECKDEFPIYDPINKKCITPDQCSVKENENNHYGRCVEHCPIYYDGCNACQCPNIGDSFCSNLYECLNQVDGPRRTCFRCEVPSMEYVDCGTCDRTCDDLHPSCLQSDKCLEKCQCPLYAPIYDNGRCITAEECVNVVITVDHSNVIESGHELRQNAKSADDYALKALNGDVIQDKKRYEWQDIVVYVIIVMICVISGISLLFWPCLCMKNRKKAKSDVIESHFKPDGTRVEPLSCLPDGTMVGVVPMQSESDQLP